MIQIRQKRSSSLCLNWDGWIVRTAIRHQIQHIIPQSVTSFEVAIGCVITSKHYNENIAQFYYFIYNALYIFCNLDKKKKIIITRH